MKLSIPDLAAVVMAMVVIVVIVAIGARQQRRQNASWKREAERQQVLYKACHAKCDNPTHIAKWTSDEGCLCFPVERLGGP